MPHDKSKTSYSNRPLPESQPKKKEPPHYLLRAQELQAYTINTCRDINSNPDRGGKGLSFYLLVPMGNLAQEITAHCAAADDNYPTCRQDWIDRRRDLYAARRAAKELSSMLTVALQVKSFNVSEHVVEEWAKKINRVIALLNKTIKSHEENKQLLEVDY